MAKSHRSRAKGKGTKKKPRLSAAEKREKVKRSRAALKGWKTRRKHERQRSARAKRGWVTRRKREKEGGKGQVPITGQLVTQVLYDGHAEDPPTEHFWSNIRHLAGQSISNILSRIPAEEGVVTVTFKVRHSDEAARLAREEEVDVDDFLDDGETHDTSWETEIDPDGFWSTYFDHAREELPKAPGKDTTDGDVSLLVTKMVIVYAPGEVSADQE